MTSNVALASQKTTLVRPSCFCRLFWTSLTSVGPPKRTSVSSCALARLRSPIGRRESKEGRQGC